MVAGFAFVFVVGLFSCSSSEENEPTTPPVDPTPPVESGIGFSVNQVFLEAFSESDTIFFDSHDWTLSSVSFGGEMNRKYPQRYPLTTYITDLSGSSAFDEDVSWLHLHYIDKKLVLSDIDPFYDQEFPKYRYAYLEFRCGEVTDTIVCENESEMPMGGGWQTNPGTVVFPAKGATVNVMARHHYWVFTELRAGEAKHLFTAEEGTQDFKDYWTDPDAVFGYTLDWLTIERNKHGDPKEITITVAPNTTGAEREFKILCSGLAPSTHGICAGRQLAD